MGASHPTSGQATSDIQSLGTPLDTAVSTELGVGPTPPADIPLMSAATVFDNQPPPDARDRGALFSSTVVQQDAGLDMPTNWAQEDPLGSASRYGFPCSAPGSQRSSPTYQDWDLSLGLATWGGSPLRLVTGPQAVLGTDFPTTVVPSTSSPLLPPDVALLTLQDHPELLALLSLLPSKHDMHSVACDLKSVWRQDLQIVQAEVNTLQSIVQKLEEPHSSMQQLFTAAQETSSAKDSLQHNLITQLDDL